MGADFGRSVAVGILLHGLLQGSALVAPGQPVARGDITFLLSAGVAEHTRPAWRRRLHFAVSHMICLPISANGWRTLVSWR
jgi:hypothetical protein